MDTYGIVLLCIVGAILTIWLIDKFTHGKLVACIVQWRPVLTAMTTLVSAVAAVLPSDYFKTVNTILRAVCDGTVTAEELWKMNEIEKSERNAYAKSLIADKLDKAGIVVTEQIGQVIDGVIAVVCMLLPHEEKIELSAGEAEQIQMELGI